MQHVTTEGRRSEALALFQDGKFEHAAHEFRTELDEHESSEGWNDWAAAEIMCGRIEAAIAGFTRALHIREAYRLFTLLEESVKERVLEWMEQAGEANYRLRAIGALVAFEKKDWPRALQLLRAAGDQRPEDPYVERVRVHTEAKWHAADTAHANPFAGLAEYLKESFCAVPWENLEIGS